MLQESVQCAVLPCIVTAAQWGRIKPQKNRSASSNMLLPSVWRNTTTSNRGLNQCATNNDIQHQHVASLYQIMNSVQARTVFRKIVVKSEKLAQVMAQQQHCILTRSLSHSNNTHYARQQHCILTRSSSHRNSTHQARQQHCILASGKLRHAYRSRSRLVLIQLTIVKKTQSVMRL